MNTAYGAEAYDPVEDLALVTSYFNPGGYGTKARNYEIFRDVIARSELNLLTIECAFGENGFSLRPAPDVLQVRAKHVMWQKERLLNLAISRLPARYTKIAWLDCDILFENPRWAVETSRMLDRFPVVQPFATTIRLPKGSRDYRGKGDVLKSFGAVHAKDRTAVKGGNYDKHGETGLGWAARRELLAAVPLYDACIIGGGDHVMVHAMCRDWVSPCIYRLMGLGNAHWRHFIRWGKGFYRNVRGEIGHVSGAALHLWHGERTDRRYSLRHRELEKFAFNPKKDVRIGDLGCWEWATDKREMHRWAEQYFIGRNEDGDASPSIVEIKAKERFCISENIARFVSRFV